MIGVAAVGDVALVTIDRPQRRNALDIEHCEALADAVTTAAADGARAITITGVGTSFCAGADFSGVYGDGFRDALYSALRTVRHVPVPVLAAVNGPAIGAGTQLAIACDLRVCAATAIFSVPTANLGLAADPWTIRRLAQLVGTASASAIVIACEQLDATEAHRHGLVNRLGDLDDTLAWAAEIGARAPLTMAYSKAVLDSMTEDEASDELLAAFEACWHSEDFKEAQLARSEKRRPVFRGA